MNSSMMSQSHWLDSLPGRWTRQWCPRATDWIAYLVDELINDVPEPLIGQLEVDWAFSIWCDRKESNSLLITNRKSCHQMKVSIHKSKHSLLITNRKLCFSKHVIKWRFPYKNLNIVFTDYMGWFFDIWHMHGNFKPLNNSIQTLL